MFTITHTDATSKARIGQLHTAHGDIETPVFMPVGTYGCVKTLSPDELKALGADIMLCNTYHLHLRPTDTLIKSLGGLHNFISWDRPILTDSGGFQVYSLAELRQISEVGVSFKSHLDGSSIFFTPEKSIEIQENLSSDIMMAFDECPSTKLDKTYIEKSMALTKIWAKKCKEHKTKNGNLLFGIVQGGIYKDLREQSVKDIVEVGFDGYAIGGLSVGEPKDVMYNIAAFTANQLPQNYPRYVMGVGTPEDILYMISMGIDMFDCVMPTRNARNGLLFTMEGKVHIKNKCYGNDPEPIDKNCECYTCKKFSKAYLRHLYKVKEMLAYRLNTIHNLYFYISLVKKAKCAIKNGNFDTFLRETIKKL